MIKPKTVRDLRTTTKKHTEAAEYLKFVDAALIGGTKIEPYRDKFIHPRFEEEYDSYMRRLRLAKYHPVVGSAINEVLSKFETGVFSIDGEENVATEARRINESLGGIQYLSEILRKLLKYQHLYVVIEPVKVSGNLTSLAQQKKAFADYLPNISVYTPYSVVSEGDDWFKVILKRQKTTPDETYYEYTIRYVMPEGIYNFTFQSDVNDVSFRLPGEVEFSTGDSLEITPIFTPSLKLGYYFKQSLPDEKYFIESVMDLQIAYAEILNAQYDAARDAGVHQKWYEPVEDNVDDIPEEMSEGQVVANNTLFKAKKFAIAEIEGTCISTQQTLLDSIIKNIKHTISLSGLSFNDKSQNASGVSKRFELIQLEATLKAYGVIMTQLYQGILKFVLVLKGYSQTEVDGLSITGLDTFDVDNADITLSYLKQMKDIDFSIFPQPLINFLVLKTAGQLNPNASDVELTEYAAGLSEFAEELPKNSKTSG
jgi:hypothetical protein